MPRPDIRRGALACGSDAAMSPTSLHRGRSGPHDLAVLDLDLPGEPALLADGQQRIELDRAHHESGQDVAGHEEEVLRTPAQMWQHLDAAADPPPAQQRPH